jgi:hypothetical protein
LREYGELVKKFWDVWHAQRSSCLAECKFVDKDVAFLNLGENELSDQSWRLGRICGVEDTINPDKAALVAEIYSKAISPDDGGLVACYFLAQDLDQEDAERAMLFFSAQASLLIDTSKLVEDAGAEFPALVTIRYSDSIPAYMATALQWDFLRMLPDEEVISQDGWEIFCAYDAIAQGKDVGPADELPPFDYRALRRKIFANRASAEDDRNPWLAQEHETLRNLTKNNPEGSESFIATADDMEAALNGEVDVGDRFSIIIPTKVERNEQTGAIPNWIPQTGREIVVAHDLNPLQAARALKVVTDAPDQFVSKSELQSGVDVREIVCTPMAVPDKALNWISTDFSGRRDQLGYDRLQSALNAHPGAEEQAVAASSMSR